jgi:hypothetical protein
MNIAIPPALQTHCCRRREQCVGVLLTFHFHCQSLAHIPRSTLLQVSKRIAVSCKEAHAKSHNVRSLCVKPGIGRGMTLPGQGITKRVEPNAISTTCNSSLPLALWYLLLILHTQDVLLITTCSHTKARTRGGFTPTE